MPKCFTFFQQITRPSQEDKSDDKNEEDKSDKSEKKEDEEKKDEEEKDEKEDSRWVMNSCLPWGHSSTLIPYSDATVF